ncbi:hypothetical protein [Flavobacterium nitratireducens]|uniref:hypothetical protein n=1 Tax=Flavobacterium nitratireducens TaxID=992289 RepID=UPI0024154004|nr:hypothetical protein [Flavobacterium nitratireducens]
MIIILKTVIALIILTFVGINLLSFIFRSLNIIMSLPASKSSGVNKMIKQSLYSEIVFFIFSIILTVGYFYAINHFYNILLVIAAALIMISRLPDLLIEIKTGEKTTKKNMKQRPIDIIFNILFFVAIPIIWYSFKY